MESLELRQIYGLNEIKKQCQRKKSPKSRVSDHSHFVQKFRNGSNSASAQITAILANKQLRIINKNTETVMALDFWTRVRPIFSEGSLIGIRVDANAFQTYDLYSPDAEILQKWRDELKKYTISWGFYEDFKPLSKIGKGKNASVFLARRRANGEKIAVKAFLKRELDQDPKSRFSLQNEVEIMRGLNHPNVIKLFGLYQTEKSYYMTMEYAEGQTLKSYIEKEPLSYQICIEILKELAKGLKYLADKNIAHRDIKPENILINPKNQVPIIVDFGLSTYCHSKQYIYTHCGTPGYVAPEILNSVSRLRVTPSADIFSLGIVFHLLLFRKFPYLGRNYNEILQQNRQAQFNFNALHYAHLPQFAKELLEQMLETNPQKRITAKRLLKQLDHDSSSSESESMDKKSTTLATFSDDSNDTNSFTEKFEHRQKVLRGGSLDLVIKKRIITNY